MSPTTSATAAAFARRALGLALLAVSPLRAQEVPDAVTIGSWVVVRSTVLSENRPLQIHLPDSYGRSDTRYPVLFLLDGDAHFLHVSGITQFLAAQNRMPEMIVVSIPNTRDRTHDLTPPAAVDSARFPLPGSSDTLTQHFPTAGGAADFLSFLSDEVAPWVDARYRTLPYRVLVGHSFGGLLVLDALLDRPQAFQGYVAVSPSLWWDDGAFAKELEERLPTEELKGRSLYMTTGGEEGPSMIDPARALATSLEMAQPAGFRSWYRVMPHESHGSNPHRTIYDGLETIFGDWALPESVMERAIVTGDLDGVDARYAAASRQYGLDIEATEPLLNRIGYAVLQFGKPEAAVRVFERNVAAHPASPNAYDSLADGLEAAGRTADALATQREALRRAEAAGYAGTDAIRAHLKRLEGKAGGGA